MARLQSCRNPRKKHLSPQKQTGRTTRPPGLLLSHRRPRPLREIGYPDALLQDATVRVRDLFGVRRLDAAFTPAAPTEASHHEIATGASSTNTVTAHQRPHHPARRRTDLVSLAIQFRVGHRHPGWRKPGNDRHFPRDGRHGRPKSLTPRNSRLNDLPSPAPYRSKSKCANFANRTYVRAATGTT